MDDIKQLEGELITIIDGKKNGGAHMDHHKQVKTIDETRKNKNGRDEIRLDYPFEEYRQDLDRMLSEFESM